MPNSGPPHTTSNGPTTRLNGHLNGHADVDINGYTNGDVNGYTNGHTNGHALEDDEMELDSAPVPPRKKKAKRGRPRVETSPTAMVDKRRLQIRLAQRAYRQRKETTIQQLSEREEFLISIIKRLTASLDRLDNSAVHSNMSSLDPGMAALFRKEFSIMRAATDPTIVNPPNKDDDQAAGGADINGLQSPNDANHSGYSNGSQRPLLPRGPAQPGSQTQGEVFHTYMPWGYEPADANASSSRPRVTVGDVVGATSQGPPPLPFGLVDVSNNELQVARRRSSPNDRSYDLEDFDNLDQPMSPPTYMIPDDQFSIPHLPMNTSPTPFTTFSFNEITFERRLSRAALESGYQLLHSADVRPALLHYVFKLSLPWLTIPQLKEKFRILLARNQDEGLDWWDAPFIHLGGAGVHYPRRDANGNPILYQHTYWARIGPLHLNQLFLEGLTRDGKRDSRMLSLESFDGMWFDAHDVEGYLKEQYGWKFESTDRATVLIDNGDDLARGIQPRPSSVSSLQSAPRGKGSTFPDRRGSDESLHQPSLAGSSSSSSPSTSESTSDRGTMPLRNPNGQQIPNGLSLVPRAQSSINTRVFLNQSQNLAQASGRIGYPMDRHLGLDCSTTDDLGYAADPNWNGTRDLSWLGPPEFDYFTLPEIKKSNKTCHTLNVQALIKDLVQHAVCLGRAPGFRKKDVDMAVRKCVSLGVEM